MCRIVYMPMPGLVEEQDLLDLFLYLETKQGGEGNGLAIVYQDEILAHKGISVEVDELAYQAANMGGPTLFHTRRATSGGVCDDLCQPFVIDNMAVAHNGMWRDWEDAALQLIMQDKMDGALPINDSLTAATLAARLGRYTLETIKLGVFVVMTTTGAWLHLRGGSFEFCEDLGIYASEFPKDWPKSRAIRADSIALLTEDGPDFEDGGWRTYASKTPRIPGVVMGGAPTRRKWNVAEQCWEDVPLPLQGDEGEVWVAGQGWIEVDEDDAALAELAEYYQQLEGVSC